MRFPVTFNEPAPEITPDTVVLAAPVTWRPPESEIGPERTRLPAAALTVAPAVARETDRVWVAVDWFTRLPARVIALPERTKGPEPGSKAIPETESPTRLF